MNKDKKFWNKVAKFYAKFMAKNNTIYYKLSEILAEYLSANSDALEIGCGTGQLSFLIAENVKSLTATDFSDNMISICNHKNTAKNIIFQQEDGSSLSFADNSFDLVIAGNILHIVPNIDKVIAEVKRVVKPDGIIFAPTFVYDRKGFNVAIWFLEKIGFKTYSKFSSEEYINYLKSKDLEIIYKGIIKAKPLDECVVLSKKII